jgi:hypothetical protein
VLPAEDPAVVYVDFLDVFLIMAAEFFIILIATTVQNFVMQILEYQEDMDISNLTVVVLLIIVITKQPFLYQADLFQTLTATKYCGLTVMCVHKKRCVESAAGLTTMLLAAATAEAMLLV